MLKINKDFKPVSPENEYGIHEYEYKYATKLTILKTEIKNNKLIVTYEDEYGIHYTTAETGLTQLSRINNFEYEQ